MTRVVRTVLLIVAIDSEAAPIVSKLQLNKDEPSPLKAPTTASTFSGTCGGLKVHLAQNGGSKQYGVCKVGTTAASLTAHLAIDAFKPDLVISAGTAGGFRSRGASIGSIFVAETCLNHDRRIALPGFKEFGLDKVPTLGMPNIVQELGLQSGVVSTGNSLDYTSECLAIMNEHEAAVKEMEAAAIADVCREYDVPFTAVKAITDIVDGDKATEVEFIQNLGRAVDALKDALARILPAMDGRTLSEL